MLRRENAVEEQRVQRKLAAILAADLAGYSRLTGADEEGTIARLWALRRELIDPAIDAHRGRIVKTTGDGILIEFASVVDAVRCAVKVQKGMTSCQDEQPRDQRLEFRIGIHIGDVVVDGDDLLGDGVNVAARIEGTAEPGGICLSDDAYRQVKDKMDVVAEDLGEQRLKNIAQPVRVHRVRLGEDVRKPVLALPDKPSIAVLPFQNMSGDREQEYFADGMVEEIVTALSRIRWLFVIARNSSFTYKGRAVDVKQVGRDLGVRYVLEGSVRKSNNRVRITGQLVDASTGAHLWADRFEGGLEDVFELQDRVTLSVVGVIEPQLSRAERERAKVKKLENLDAWTLYQRGMSHLYLCTREDLSEARSLFNQAISLDPNLAPAHSGLGEVCYYEFVYGFAKSAQENRETAIGPAQRAVALDPDDAGAHCTLGRVRYLRREYAAAILELQRALELNPSLALAHYGLGAALVFSGRSSEASPHLDQAIRLSPRDPNMGSFLVRIADAKYFARDYEGAFLFALRALGQPNFQWSRYAVLIAALGQLGRIDEARQYLHEVKRQRPDFSTAFVRRTHLFGDASDVAHFHEGMGKAGVAEE
jgi:adenylate cyclase